MPMLMPDGTLDREWIEAHNARVAAFWAEIDPLVNGMTDEQCRQVVNAGLDEGLSMNRVAQKMREEIGGKWEAEYDVAVGMALYRSALERLDKYDPDFRPRPERQLIAECVGYDVFYLTDEGHYEVVSGTLSERFRATYRPKFGMDIADAEQAAAIAEKLKTVS